MPGKAGPEHAKRTSGSNEIFLLPGAYPIPKPSYGEPRRASLSVGSPINGSQSWSFDTSRRASTSSASAGEVPPLPQTPESGLGSTFGSTYKSYDLLNKASLEKSTDSDLGGSRKINIIHSRDSDNTTPPPPPLPSTPIPGTENNSENNSLKGGDGDKSGSENNPEGEKPPPLSGRERLKLIEEELSQEKDSEESSGEEIQKFESEDPVSEQESDEEGSTWTSVNFHNKRDKFERMASQDGGHISSTTDINESSPPTKKSQGSVSYIATDQSTWVPSDTALAADKSLSRSKQLSTQSLDSQQNLASSPGSSSYVNRIKENYQQPNNGMMSSSFEDLRHLNRTPERDFMSPNSYLRSYDKDQFSQSLKPNASLGFRSTLKCKVPPSVKLEGPCTPDKDGTSYHGHVGHHQPSLNIHKTSSDEDVSFSTHLDPHHNGPHYVIHKTSSEEDLSMPKVDVMADVENDDDDNDVIDNGKDHITDHNEEYQNRGMNGEAAVKSDENPQDEESDFEKREVINQDTAFTDNTSDSTQDIKDTINISQSKIEEIMDNQKEQESLQDGQSENMQDLDISPPQIEETIDAHKEHEAAYGIQSHSKQDSTDTVNITTPQLEEPPETHTDHESMHYIQSKTEESQILADIVPESEMNGQQSSEDIEQAEKEDLDENMFTVQSEKPESDISLKEKLVKEHGYDEDRDIDEFEDETKEEKVAEYDSEDQIEKERVVSGSQSVSSSNMPASAAKYKEGKLAVKAKGVGQAKSNLVSELKVDDAVNDMRSKSQPINRKSSTDQQRGSAFSKTSVPRTIDKENLSAQFIDQKHSVLSAESRASGYSRINDEQPATLDPRSSSKSSGYAMIDNEQPATLDKRSSRESEYSRIDDEQPPTLDKRSSRESTGYSMINDDQPDSLHKRSSRESSGYSKIDDEQAANLDKRSSRKSSGHSRIDYKQAADLDKRSSRQSSGHSRIDDEQPATLDKRFSRESTGYSRIDDEKPSTLDKRSSRESTGYSMINDDQPSTLDKRSSKGSSGYSNIDDEQAANLDKRSSRESSGHSRIDYEQPATLDKRASRESTGYSMINDDQPYTLDKRSSRESSGYSRINDGQTKNSSRNLDRDSEHLMRNESSLSKQSTSKTSSRNLSKESDSMMGNVESKLSKQAPSEISSRKLSRESDLVMRNVESKLSKQAPSEISHRKLSRESDLEMSNESKLGRQSSIETSNRNLSRESESMMGNVESKLSKQTPSEISTRKLSTESDLVMRNVESKLSKQAPSEMSSRKLSRESDLVMRNESKLGRQSSFETSNRNLSRESDLVMRNVESKLSKQAPSEMSSRKLSRESDLVMRNESKLYGHSRVSVGYAASVESANDPDLSKKDNDGGSYTSIANSSGSELKRINVENSAEENENFRAATPKDGRFIDPNKMAVNEYHFKRIATEESSATEPEEYSRSRKMPRRKRPVSGRNEQLNAFLSASDVGHTTENDGDREFSDSDDDPGISNDVDEQEEDIGSDEAEHLHSILTSGHCIHKKKESKVHFDDSHLYETKYFKSQDNAVQQTVAKVSSDDDDLDNLPTNNEIDHGAPRRQNRKSFRNKAKRLEAKQVAGPMDPKNNSSKSAAMMEKIKTDQLDSQTLEREKHQQRSLPSLSEATVKKMVDQLRPLVLEEMATLDGQRESMNVPAAASNEVARLLSGLLHRAVDSIRRIEYPADSSAQHESASLRAMDNTQSSEISEDDSHRKTSEQKSSGYRNESIEKDLDLHLNGPGSSSEIDEHVQSIHYPRIFTPSNEKIPEIDISKYENSIEEAFIREGVANQRSSERNPPQQPSPQVKKERPSSPLIDHVKNNQLHSTHSDEEAKVAIAQNRDFPPQTLDTHEHVESHSSTPHALYNRSEAEKSKSLYAYAVLSNLIKKIEPTEDTKMHTGKQADSVPHISSASKLDALIHARDALEKHVFNDSENDKTVTSRKSVKKAEQTIPKQENLSEQQKREIVKSITDMLPAALQITKSERRKMDLKDGIDRQSSSRLVDKVRRKLIDQSEYEKVCGVQPKAKQKDVLVNETVKEKNSFKIFQDENQPSTSYNQFQSKTLPLTTVEENIRKLQQRSMPTTVSPSKLLPKRPNDVDDQHLQTHSQQDRVKQEALQYHSPSVIDEYDSTYNVFDYTTPSALIGMFDSGEKSKSVIVDREDSNSRNQQVPNYSAITELLAKVIEKESKSSDPDLSSKTDIVALSAALHAITDKKALKQQQQKEMPSTSSNEAKGSSKYQQKSPHTLGKMISSVKKKSESKVPSRNDFDLGLDRASEVLGSDTSLRKKSKHDSDEELNQTRWDSMMSWISLQEARSDQEERVSKRAVPEALSPAISFDDRRMGQEYDSENKPEKTNDDSSESGDDVAYRERIKVSRSDPLNEYTENSLLDLLYEYCNQNPALAFSDPDLPPELVRQLISLMSVNSTEELGDRSREEATYQTQHRPSHNNNVMIAEHRPQVANAPRTATELLPTDSSGYGMATASQMTYNIEAGAIPQDKVSQDSSGSADSMETNVDSIQEAELYEGEDDGDEKFTSSRKNEQSPKANANEYDYIYGQNVETAVGKKMQSAMSKSEYGYNTGQDVGKTIGKNISKSDYGYRYNQGKKAMEVNGDLQSERKRYDYASYNKSSDTYGSYNKSNDTTVPEYRYENTVNRALLDMPSFAPASHLGDNFSAPYTKASSLLSGKPLTPSDLLIKKIIAQYEQEQPKSKLQNFNQLPESELQYFNRQPESNLQNFNQPLPKINVKYDDFYKYETQPKHNIGKIGSVTPSYKTDVGSNSYDDTYIFSPSTPTTAAADVGNYDTYYGRDSQMTGASLPSSPSPDNALSTGRRSAMGTADARSFMVEKELIESQLRKLQVENSSLQTENKLLKEKYNRSQNRVQTLEGQLLNHRHEADTMHSTLDEISITSRKSRSHNEHERQELEDRVLKLTRQLETLKAENASLERQLESSRRSSDLLKHSTDKSHIVEGFRAELIAMREELSKVKGLLDQAERDRQAESEKRKEAAAQVVKLTEMKTLLQHQIENSGGSVAEKQVKSLETRLKITEDRFHQERADRAGKLSEVEEKLLNDNSKLQVSEKEFSRQLQREKEKNRNLDNKYKDTKDDNEKLRIALGEKPTSLQNLPHHAKYSKISPSLASKKPSEMKYIMDQLQKEDGLSPEQKEDMVWLLWHRHEQSSKLLCLWEGALKELEVDPENIGAGFKNLRDERTLYEDKLQRYKETIDDLSHERETLQTTMHKQLSDLVSDKHTSYAQMRNIEDQNVAIRAENESLRSSLKMSGLGNTSLAKSGDVSTWEAQLESLQSELHSARGDLHQNTRQNKLLEAELNSIRAQYSAKERSLNEALDELTRVGSSRSGDREIESYTQQKADKLTAQVKSLEAESHHWQDKHTTVARELDELETKYSQLQRQMARAKFTTDGRIVDPATESEKLALESDLNEKDEQILHLTVSYNETENELQRTKQQLVLQQQHTDSIGEEMEQLHTEIRQKKLLSDKMANAESEHQVSQAALRENLDKLNKELADISHQLKLKTVELNHQNSKVQKLEQDLNERDRILSGNIARAIQDGSIKSTLLETGPSVTGDTLTHAETQIRLLQYDLDKSNHKTEKTTSALEGLVQENVDLVSQTRRYQQELVCERAKLCQLVCDKSDLEKRLNVLEEENVASRKEKASLEQDLTKQEVAVGNLVERLESEAERTGDEFQQKFRELDKQGKIVAMELATVKRLLEARERETDLLRDTIDRQKQENLSLNRRIQVMREENGQSSQDIDNLTKELSKKMKETAIVAETSQTLASERAKLQLEKHQLETDHRKDNTDIERKLIEIQGLQKKLDKAEEKQRSTENQLHQKETQLVAIEMELRHLKKEVTQLEHDKTDLKKQNNALNEEMRHVGSVKDTLEQRLNMEKNTLSKEQSDSTHMKESLTQTSTQLEMVKREYDILYASLEQEKKVVQTLKSQCQQEEDNAFKLQDDLRTRSLELETMKRHLEDSRASLEHARKEKQTLQKDVQDLCKQLSEKDDALNRVKEKASDTVESVRHDYNVEKTHLIQDKQRLENELYRLREELDELREKLRNKENQIDMFMRTNKDLENGVREKYELENAVSNQLSELNDLRRNVTRLEADSARLAEANKNLQLNLEEARQSNASLKEENRSLSQNSTQETGTLSRKLSEERRLRELETQELREQYKRTSIDLQTAQNSLSSIQENRDLLANTNKSQEYTMDSLKTQLYEESTARRLAEQRVETLQGQIQDIRENKSGYEERTAELQARYAKIEAQLSLEKNKFSELKQEFDELQDTSFHNESQAKAYHTKLGDLEYEVTNLRNQLDTSKQDLVGKNKRLSLEMKQHTENYEKDRNKLMAQAEQLAVDLDKSRQQIATKNRENLSIQEQVLVLESQLRESTNKIKELKESLRHEQETRDKLDKRIMELDLLLAKLRTKDGSDMESFETTKSEVQKMLTELSRRMQSQLDTQKGQDSEQRSRDSKRIDDLKQKISQLESSLSQEQAMHIVSKTQLQSLEDDNQRLRQNLQSLRKRQAAHTDNADRNKNRIEAINEIIAKSQSQAQQMLASGHYNVDSDAGFRPYGSTQQLPNSQYWMLTSPRGPLSDNNRSLGSEDITLGMLNGTHNTTK